MDEVARKYGGRTAVASWSEISGSELSDSGTVAPALLMGMGGRHQTSGMASKGRLCFLHIICLDNLGTTDMGVRSRT